MCQLARYSRCSGVRVSIRTPTRDVHCDAFDYDLFTRFAQVSASPGRRVSVLTRGTARPIQAERVLWNMVEDTVLITRGRASGAP